MSYAQSASNPPQVFNHLKTMWNDERDAFPGQLARAKQWTSQAEEKLEAEIKSLEAKGENYLRGNPKVAEHLRMLKEKLVELKEQGETRFNSFVHSKDSHSGIPPPNEIHSLQHYGPGRIAVNYGEAAAARAGETHEAMATGSASHRW